MKKAGSSSKTGRAPSAATSPVITAPKQPKAAKPTKPIAPVAAPPSPEHDEHVNEDDDNDNEGDDTAAAVAADNSDDDTDEPAAAAPSSAPRTLADMLAEQTNASRAAKLKNEAAALRGIKRSRINDDFENDDNTNDGEGDEAAAGNGDGLPDINEDEEDDGNGGSDGVSQQSIQQQQPKRKRKKSDAPMEMSSKVPVSRHRQVIANKGPKTRDPRFDDMCGDYKQDLFKSAYKFIGEKKTAEAKQLAKTIPKIKNPEAKAQAEAVLAKYKQEAKLREKKEKSAAAEVAWRKGDRDAQKLGGKAAFFLKKRDKRNLSVAADFLTLKKTGKLEAAMEKKRKQNSQKDHRWMPNAPRE